MITFFCKLTAYLVYNFYALSALKIWGDEREFTVSTKEEDIVSVDAARGILTARTLNQETMVSENQLIYNHCQRGCRREGNSQRQGPQSGDKGE